MPDFSDVLDIAWPGLLGTALGLLLARWWHRRRDAARDQ